jgi:hypothetical protein
VVGKPYWVALRLFEIAAAHWREIDGSAILDGVDLQEVLHESPSRFLNAIYVLAIRGLDDTKRAQFDFELNEPPPWELDTEPSAEILADDAAAWAAAAASFQALKG